MSPITFILYIDSTLTTHLTTGKQIGRYTPDIFVDRARTIHGNKYDYSSVIWIDTTTAESHVDITCPIHGIFTQTISGHISGKYGCSACSGKARWTYLRFVVEASSVHLNKYDYSSVVWTDATTTNSKVEITCHHHGIFTQTIKQHIRYKNGCPACSGKARWTHERFITEARTIHGDKYDYSSVVWMNSTNVNSKLAITCPTHGRFKQSIGHHINSRQGCVHCANRARLTHESFATKSNVVHTNKYDYSSVVWTDTTTAKSKVDITCPAHGIFTQRISNHLNNAAGCPTCTGNTVWTREIFLERAHGVHGSRYDYSIVSWTDDTTTDDKLEIICKNHGVFKQSIASHIRSSQGCPKCKSSKGETAVMVFLEKHSIRYEHEKVFIDCRNPPTGGQLRFDFWLPDHNTCIEFHGAQHYTPYIFDKRNRNDWSEDDKQRACTNLEEIQARDAIKVDYCNKKCITLITIPYHKVKSIDDLLSTIL